MDPKELSTLLKWPCPQDLCAVQHFLEFSVYYRQFVPHFSTPVVHIASLTMKGCNTKNWTPQDEEAFLQLQKCTCFVFCSAHSLPFLLKVDASSVGVGSVLSQRNNKR